MSATHSAANGAPPPPPDDSIARVRKQIAAAGLSQAAAASEIGVSGAALSTWLKGKYKGDSDGLDRKCERWLATRAERATLEASLPPPPQWVETTAALKVAAALGYAQIARDLAVVHGAAGAGKTTAARRYADRRPNVWLVQASRGTRSLGSCLRRVARVVNAVPEGRSIADVEDALAERLSGTGGLLIVDEAQCLSLPALDGLRQLHDASGTGLALVGGEALWKRIAGNRASAELAQLFSRVGRRAELGRRELDQDAAALLAAWDGLGEDARAAALPIASQPGGLRALVKAINWAAVEAAGGEVERRHVAAAWRELGGS